MFIVCNFWQIVKCDKTAQTLKENVPHPSKMFPSWAGGAGRLFHLCGGSEDEHRHAVHAFISCSWIHNMLIPESITGISCFMFRPKPSQRLPTLHGRALHGFHFHHHVSPGLIPCNYGKNHAVHGTCHGSAWSLCQTQKKVKSWRIIKSFSL